MTDPISPNDMTARGFHHGPHGYFQKTAGHRQINPGGIIHHEWTTLLLVPLAAGYSALLSQKTDPSTSCLSGTTQVVNLPLAVSTVADLDRLLAAVGTLFGE